MFSFLFERWTLITYNKKEKRKKIFHWDLKKREQTNLLPRSATCWRFFSPTSSKAAKASADKTWKKNKVDDKKRGNSNHETMPVAKTKINSDKGEKMKEIR